jgi:UDP-N-acetyl-D-mannosaminuronate dehydrogenase
VGAADRFSAEQAARHFESIGLKTKIVSSPEVAEVAKVSETTFFGLMIAWAQEVELYADRLGEDYGELSPSMRRLDSFHQSNTFRELSVVIA